MTDQQKSIISINFKKFYSWIIERLATIALTFAVGGLIQVCVSGFQRFDVFYSEFQELKRNSKEDIIAHRQIAINDSLLTIYKDSVNNRFLFVEGTLNAHQEVLQELKIFNLNH